MARQFVRLEGFEQLNIKLQDDYLIKKPYREGMERLGQAAYEMLWDSTPVKTGFLRSTTELRYEDLADYPVVELSQSAWYAPFVAARTGYGLRVYHWILANMDIGLKEVEDGIDALWGSLLP